MLGQYQTASQSLDGLQYKSHILVMFGIPESSLHHTQTLGRIDREWQASVPMYYYLITKGTIEDSIHRMMRRKVDYSQETLDRLLVEEW